MAGSRKLTVEIIGDAKGLGKAFGEAEGSAKKLGDGLDDTGRRGTDLADKIGKATLAAGAAIGAFAVASVKEFQDLGVEVGKFSAATGLSADAASRWIEVAGDLGVESGTLEAAMNKMNVTLGKSPADFAALGVEIARTKDGAVDANETFLNVVDRLNAIQDPARRAEAGTKLLGRGWKETAELIQRGAPQLRRDLDNVADSKVFTDKDVSEARSLRSAFDSIGDAVDELQLNLGRKLAPAIVSASEVIVELVDSAGPLVDVLGDALVQTLNDVKPLVAGLGDLVGVVGSLVEMAGGISSFTGVVGHLSDEVDDSGMSFAEAAVPIVGWKKALDEGQHIVAEVVGDVHALTSASDEQTTALDELQQMMIAGVQAAYAEGRALQEKADKLAESQQAAQRARDEENRLAEAARRVEQAVRDQDAAWDLIFGRIDESEALNDLGRQFDDLVGTIMTATANAEQNAATTEQGMRDVASEVAATKESVAEYGKEILGLPPERVTQFLAMIDEGQYADVERRLGILSRNRTMQLSIDAKGGIGSGSLTVKVDQFDTGGVVPGPRGAPRLIMAHGGETVLPTHRSGTAGVGNVTVIVNGSVVTERDLVQAVWSGLLDGQRRGELVGSL